MGSTKNHKETQFKKVNRKMIKRLVLKYSGLGQLESLQKQVGSLLLVIK